MCFKRERIEQRPFRGFIRRNGRCFVFHAVTIRYGYLSRQIVTLLMRVIIVFYK